MKILILVIFIIYQINCNVYSDEAKFERLSHFKGAIGQLQAQSDLVDLAMIAEGSCRMFNPSQPSYFFWHSYDKKVNPVLQSILQLPDTQNQDEFVKQMDDKLPQVCQLQPYDDQNDIGKYQIDQIGQSMNNWYQALCHATATSGCTKPWQKAVTIGYVCIVACDAHHSQQDFHMNLEKLAESSESAQNGVIEICQDLNNKFLQQEPDFKNVKSILELQELTKNITIFCGC